MVNDDVFVKSAHSSAKDGIIQQRNKGKKNTKILDKIQELGT